MFYKITIWNTITLIVKDDFTKYVNLGLEPNLEE